MPFKKKRQSRRKKQVLTPRQYFMRFFKPLYSELRTIHLPLSTTHQTATANGSGVVTGNIVCDPTATTYTELVDIKALYSSYRLLTAELELYPVDGNTSHAPMMLASLLNTGIGNPSGYDQVTDNINHLIWNPATDTRGTSPRIYLSANRRINFQEWGTASTDDQGAPGGFYWYGSNFTNSSNVFGYVLRAVFEVRNRI